MRRNYGLLTDLPRTMGHAILFGWDLICHMLGGPVVVCRRLKNARSDQEKTAGVLLGADVYQMVLGKSSGIRFSIPEISIYGEKIHFLFNLFKFYFFGLNLILLRSIFRVHRAQSLLEKTTYKGYILSENLHRSHG